jgi:hypothetical protein
MRLRIRRELLRTQLFVEFFFLELFFSIVAFLKKAPGQNLEECLAVELAVFEALKSEVLGVLVGETLDCDHASGLDAGLLFGSELEGLAHRIFLLFRRFVLQTLVAVDSYDLAEP